jgi:hypothetical protein
MVAMSAQNTYFGISSAMSRLLIGPSHKAVRPFQHQPHEMERVLLRRH